jgi:hypothetical protein
MRRRSLSAEEESVFSRIAACFPDAALIYPSSTGLDKYILDAHGSLRSLMAKSAFHDYSKQGQGDENKVFRPSVVFDGQTAYAYDLSLYRPDAKEGDPRFWPSILKKGRASYPVPVVQLGEGPSFNNICVPDDLYAAIVLDGVFVMLRLKASTLMLFSEDSPSSPVGMDSVAELRKWVLGARCNADRKKAIDQKVLEGHFSYRQADGDEFVVREIVEKLQGYAGRLVESRGSGDMGVGKTVEWMLGIKANSSKDPDFQGIEIKSARTGQAKNKLTTLFSKTPDRKLSPVKPYDVVMNFGRPDEETGRHQVYATVGPEKSPRNTMGFFTTISDNGLFFELRNLPARTLLFVWPLDTLRSALMKKHRRTMWVSVDARKVGGREEFQVVGCKLTGSPNFDSFLDLIREGKITIDLTMSLKGTKQGVRDHGYLFRVDNSQLDGLFLCAPREFVFEKPGSDA